MALTTLDPTPALIVIDLQKGIVGLPIAPPAADVIRNAAVLTAGFRRANHPVVLVNVDGRAPGRTEESRVGGSFPPDFAELIPELDPQPKDIYVTKQRIGAFTGTDLDARLRALGVTQVVIVGVATSSGVEATARAAYELGYHVVTVVDAVADLDQTMHDHSVARIFPKIGERTTTAELLARLNGVVA
jgi:nicotinamidase-related amidase